MLLAESKLWLGAGDIKIARGFARNWVSL
jgi:hypothetical protein